MISKELLSEVLGKSLRNFNFYIDNNKLVYDRLFYEGCEDGHDDIINIYELAHKCKEWAYQEQYRLCSFIEPDMPYARCVITSVFSGDTINMYYEADTEPESIFQACQWVLDNKEQK